ncbi:hypothetical protein ACWDYJ_07300 [Streptomyces sp. NPDC003042]
MARRTHRFETDEEGHSVTVLLASPTKDIEVRVDGQVVDVRHKPTKHGTILAAALPTDPPRPITILIEDTDDGVPFCWLMTRYRRHVIPEVGRTRHGEGFPRHRRPHQSRGSDPASRQEAVHQALQRLRDYLLRPLA